MALTQVSTDGVKNDAISHNKIPANAIQASELADNAVDTAAIADSAITNAKIADGQINSAKIVDGSIATGDIADDAVTADKLANSINSEITANTAKTSNATHTGEVTGGTALTIADNVVDEANLKVSNSPTNGYLLSAQSGNTGGLTWVVAPSSDLVDDTSPQLGGALASNGHNIAFGDSTGGAADDRLTFGAGPDLQLFHDGSNSYVSDISTGNLKLTSNGTAVQIEKSDGENMGIFRTDGAVELYHDNAKKFETTSGGVSIAGSIDIAGDHEIVLGTGNDLTIKADGGNSAIVHNGDGDLVLLAQGSGEDIRIQAAENLDLQVSGSETAIHCDKDGAVELYHDNTKRLETASHGVTLTQAGDRIQFTASSGTPPQIYNLGSSTRDLGINIDNEHKYTLHQNGILYQLGANSSSGGAYSSVQPSYPIRAWLSFNHASNVTNGSGGISSVSDTSDGRFTVNYSTSFPDDNYVCVAMSGGQSGSHGDDTCITHGAADPGTGSIGIRCRKFTDSNFVDIQSAMLLFLR